MITRRRFLVGTGIAGVAGVGAILGHSWFERNSALNVGYSSQAPRAPTVPLNTYDEATGILWAMTMASTLTSRAKTVYEQLEAVQRWTHANVRPQYGAPQTLIADNFYNVARRGFGYCDQLSHIVATFAFFAGHDARMLFLRRADGVSPHTVTQVYIGGRWVLVDSWIGAVLRDDADQMLTVDDILDRPYLLHKFAYDTVGITPDLFARGIPFRSFPYDSIPDLVSRLDRKVTGNDKPPEVTSSVITSPLPSDAPPATSSPVAPHASREQIAAEIVAYDSARRAHLDTHYDKAIDGYAQVLSDLVDAPIARAVRFQLGLAYLDNNLPEQSKAAFDLALRADPNSEWTPSSLFFRAEARARLGQHHGAVSDLRSANIPPATSRLRLLGLEE